MDGTACFNVISQLFPAVWFTEEQNFLDLTKAGRAAFAFMSQDKKRYVLLDNLSTADAFEIVWQRMYTIPALRNQLLFAVMVKASM